MPKLPAWFVALLVCSIPALAHSEDPETRSHMRGIASDLQRILPFWLEDDPFPDTQSRETFRQSATSLASRADQLESHGTKRGEAFELFARSLRNDAMSLRQHVEAGEFGSAQAQIGPLLENCIGCHARLPSVGESPLSAQLVASVRQDSLTPANRLRLRMATRQFDLAIAELETMLTQEVEDRADGAPLKLSLHGGLVDYLILNVRVRNNLERPRAFLTAFAARGGVSDYLKSDVEQWVASLHRIPEVTNAVASPLAKAKRLLERGEELRAFPADSSGLAYDIVASGWIYRLLETSDRNITDAELAEAYYILGATESRILRPSWNDRWDDYLEMAIRKAPGSEIAWRAYRLLENETLAYWTPSWTSTLPTSVRTRLNELRVLAEGQ